MFSRFKKEEQVVDEREELRKKTVKALEVLHEKHLANSGKTEAHHELFALFRDFLVGYLHFSPAQTPDEMKQAMDKKKLKKESSEKFRHFIDVIENAKYGGKELDDHEFKALVVDMKAEIEKL